MQEEESTNMDLKKMKIPDLKKELTARGLPLKGNKQELVDRLAQYLEDNDESVLGNLTDTECTDSKVSTELLTDIQLLTQAEEETDLLGQEEEPNLLEDDDDDEDDEVEAPPSPPPPAAAAAAITPPKPRIIMVTRTVPTVKAPAALVTAPSPPKPATGNATPAVARTELTLAQKKAARAARFNTPLSEEAKKQARLEKFGGKTPGTPQSTSTVATAEALDKLKRRSERFGTAVSSLLKQTEQMDKLKKRKDRFGVITNTTPSPIATSGVRRISTEGLGDDVEAKKKKRAERFGL